MPDFLKSSLPNSFLSRSRLFQNGRGEFPEVKETTKNSRLHYFQYENQRFIGGIIMAQNFTYTQCGDYYIPDIKLAYTSTQALGKYGRMRRIFLEQNTAVCP